MVRGQRKEILENSIPIRTEAELNIHNQFDIEVIDSKTGIIKKKAKAYNLICDQLWSRMLSPNTYFNYIFFGSGQGTPSATDTSLFNHLGHKSLSSSNCVYETNKYDYVSAMQKITLTEQEYVGETITEVGIGFGADANNLCTHAMLQDMNGNQISIEKSNTDIIHIYATIFLHFNGEGYDSGHIFIIPEKNDLTQFLLGTYNSFPISQSSERFYFSPIKAILNNKSSENSSGASKRAIYSFDVEGKKMKFTAERFSAEHRPTLKGIKSLAIENAVRYTSPIKYIHIPFLYISTGGSWYPGNSIVGETIGTGDGDKMNFCTKFPFIENVKIYINGIETTDFEIDNACFDFTKTTPRGDVFQFFQIVEPESTLSDIRESKTIHPIVEITNNGYSSFSVGFSPGNEVCLYNPFYKSIMYTIYPGSYYSCFVKNENGEWEPITSWTDEIKKMPFIKIAGGNNITYNLATVNLTANPIGNINFLTPPPEGAIITADYFTEVVAKDENHVFDIEVTLQLGEYTEG